MELDLARRPALVPALAAMIRPAEPVSPHDVAGHYDELDRFYRELWGEDLHHG